VARTQLALVAACKAVIAGSDSRAGLDGERTGQGCRASLLTSAHRKVWDSSSPLSALEDEPVREPASAGKRTGSHKPLRLVSSVLRKSGQAGP
jgi:hypothetical protein